MPQSGASAARYAASAQISYIRALSLTPCRENLPNLPFHLTKCWVDWKMPFSGSQHSRGISHTNFTPITNLKTQTEVALSHARSVEQYQEILYSNLEEYERMAKMIGDMLFLAQADNKLLKPELVEIDLEAEMRILFDYFSAWAEEKNVLLVLKGEQVWMVGDRLMMRRALSNLVSNAIG